MLEETIEHRGDEELAPLPTGKLDVSGDARS